MPSHYVGVLRLVIMVSSMRWLAVLLVAGCRWATQATPSAHVYKPGGEPPRVIAALPIDCQTCSPIQRGALAVQTRMGLELAGYSIVDAELLNAEVRLRSTHTNETSSDRVGPMNVQASGGYYAPAADAQVDERIDDGASWSELAPGQQRDLLADIGVDGVLASSVVLGHSGPNYARRYTLRIAVLRLDGEIAWSADCTVVAEDYDSSSQALDRAGRCALASEALW